MEKGYKLKDSFISKTPIQREKNLGFRPRPSLASSSTFVSGSTEGVTEAAVAAAYKIADAEAKSYLASEALKELERVSKMADEADSMLILAREIFEKCKLD